MEDGGYEGVEKENVELFEEYMPCPEIEFKSEEVAVRFRIIWSKMAKLAIRASEHEETYQFVKEMMEYLCAKVDNMLLGVGGSIEEEVKEVMEKIDSRFAQVKCSNEKNGSHKSGRRLKSRYEKTGKRQKVVSPSTRLSKDVEVPHLLGHADNFQSIHSCSQASYYPQTSQANTL